MYMTCNPAIAVVSSCSDRTWLIEAALGLGGRTGPSILKAADRRGALQLLATYEVAVVISDMQLRDGDWKDFLSDTARMTQPPRLVVVAPSADASIWAEVLNLGGFDLLIEPLDPDQVRHVVASATEAFDSARQPLPRQPAGSAEVADRRRAQAQKPAVLVVESDARSRLELETAILAEGFDALLAENCAQGLALFHEHGPRISVAVLDGTILRKTCDEFFDRLWPSDVAVKVVVPSGQPVSQLEGCLKGRGVAEFLPSPFAPSALTRLLHSMAAA